MSEVVSGANPGLVLETARLRLRHLTDDDARFVLALLNEPSFIENIGDRGVRTIEGARRYLADGPIASYARHGYGLYLVELRTSGEPIGICGLVKRDYLENADLGYALLPPFCSRGYALEAAAAVKSYALETLGLGRVLAITTPGNVRSIRVLEKVGLVFQATIRPPNGEEDLSLFSSGDVPQPRCAPT